MSPLQTSPVSSAAGLFGVVLLALGAVVALVSLWYVWRASRAVRAPSLASLDTRSVGDRVVVEGTAHPGADDPLVSPLRGRECLAVRATVEERRLQLLPVPLPTWVQLARTSVAGRFRVRTPTADLPVVDPTASLVLASEPVARVAPGEPADEAPTAFERHHDVPARTRWHGRPPVVGPPARALSLGHRRYTEGTLEPGAEVFVAGRLVERETECGDAFGVVPEVVSTLSPASTLRHVVGTALVGLAAGAAAVLLGVVLVLA
jgi:hypothetical protein